MHHARKLAVASCHGDWPRAEYLRFPGRGSARANCEKICKTRKDNPREPGDWLSSDDIQILMSDGVSLFSRSALAPGISRSSMASMDPAEFVANLADDLSLVDPSVRTHQVTCVVNTRKGPPGIHWVVVACIFEVYKMVILVFLVS